MNCVKQILGSSYEETMHKGVFPFMFQMRDTVLFFCQKGHTTSIQFTRKKKVKDDKLDISISISFLYKNSSKFKATTQFKTPKCFCTRSDILCY